MTVHKHHKREFIGKIFVLMAVLCMSAIATYALPTRGYRHITVNEGLTRNSIYSMLQDSAGTVYIGTWDALHSYDGTRVRELMFTPEPKHPVRTVTSLAEGPGGRIYVGTSEGIALWDPATGSSSELRADSIGYVVQLLTDSRQRLHILTGDGRLHVFNMLTDRPERPTEAGVDRLVRLSDGTVKPLKRGLITGCRTIAAFAGSVDGELWVSTIPNGVYHRSNSNSSFKRIPVPGPEQPRIVSISAFGQEIVMASPRGLLTYNQSTGITSRIEASPTDPGALNDRNITNLMTDSEGGLWIGTFFGGINYLSPTRGNFALLDKLNPLIDGHVISSITEDDLGRLWFGVEDGGLSCHSPGTETVSNYNSRTGTPWQPFIPTADNVQGIYAYANKLYVGMAYGGIDIFDLTDGRRIAHFPPSDSAPDLPPSAYAFCKGPDEAIYCGTMSGLFRHDSTTGKLTRVTQIPDVIIHTLVAGSDGSLTAASQGAGVFTFDGKQWRNLRNSRIEMAMSALCNDSTVYIGTEGHGLYRYDRRNGMLSHVDLGLGSRLMVFSIICDGELLWLTTNRGLAAYDPASETVKRFTNNDGLQSNQFKINSSLRLDDGTIIIGSVNGVNAFHPERLTVNNTPPKAIITDFTLAGDTSGTYFPTRAASISIPSDNKGFTIRFASSSFDDIAKNKFKFRLEPEDSDWKETAAGNQTAAYPALKPGSYTFRLRASSGSGIYGAERRMEINVKRTPGESTVLLVWILGAAILCIISGTAVYFRMAGRRRPATIVISAQSSGESDSTDNPDSFLLKLNEIIEREMQNVDLSVDRLATMAGYGRSVFYRKVKNATGKTPNEFLRARRLDRAAELLAKPDARINQVCYQTGFSSPSYFSRCFAARFGVTPSDYCNLSNS